MPNLQKLFLKQKKNVYPELDDYPFPVKTNPKKNFFFDEKCAKVKKKDKNETGCLIRLVKKKVWFMYFSNQQKKILKKRKQTCVNGKKNFHWHISTSL